MSENRSLFQRKDENGNSEIDRFLESLNQSPVGSGRLIFALDATASRKPTWDAAAQLQGDMFREAASIGGLSLQLVYYRGFTECRASDWVREPERLLRLMERLDCLTGMTQIERVLDHTRKETAKEPVAALVLIGDAMEENSDLLVARARDLRIPCFRRVMTP
jgi:hypothetical protein